MESPSPNSYAPPVAIRILTLGSHLLTLISIILYSKNSQCRKRLARMSNIESEPGQQETCQIGEYDLVCKLGRQGFLWRRLTSEKSYCWNKEISMQRSETIEVKEKLEEVIEHGGSWSKLLAVSTAIIAVFAAVVSSFASNSTGEAFLQKNNAIFYQSKAADQWAFYQAKGIKLSLAENFFEQTHDPQLKQNADRYKNEQEDIRKDAQHFERLVQDANDQSTRALAKSEKWDLASLLCQIGIALSAMSALLRQKILWIGSLLLAVVALGIFVVGLF